MKYSLYFLLFILVLYFIWKTLRKISEFLKKIYTLGNSNIHNNHQQNSSPKPNKQSKGKIKWNAETIDYEEIKEDDIKK